MRVKEVAEMSFNQTRDILDHARAFHRRLIHFYEELLDRSPTEETCELIEDLVEHERVLESRLKEYEEGVSDNMLDTFFKYMVDGTEKHFAEYHVPAAVDSAYVIGAARHFDACLSRFYKEMARKALSEQVREILVNLQEMEQREQLALSKMALDLRVA
jgi:rubrerythrin